ncbi:hypothetical protein NEHOM01_2528, partial [Nematocida homosporus]|uniref:uncharacterized protein n=1 Tax=Nematocida homosporus TaxID=1912981 RepID=UPI00221FDC3F
YIQGDTSRPAGLSETQWYRFQKKVCRFVIRNSQLYYVIPTQENKTLLEVVGDDETERLKSLIKAAHLKENHAPIRRVCMILREQYMGFAQQTVITMGVRCPKCKKRAPNKSKALVLLGLKKSLSEQSTDYLLG